MPPLILKCAMALHRFWRRRDSYNVAADGVAVGRIFLSSTAPNIAMDVDIGRTQGPTASLWL